MLADDLLSLDAEALEASSKSSPSKKKLWLTMAMMSSWESAVCGSLSLVQLDLEMRKLCLPRYLKSIARASLPWYRYLYLKSSVLCPMSRRMSQREPFFNTSASRHVHQILESL